MELYKRSKTSRFIQSACAHLVAGAERHALTRQGLPFDFSRPIYDHIVQAHRPFFVKTCAATGNRRIFSRGDKMQYYIIIIYHLLGSVTKTILGTLYGNSNCDAFLYSFLKRLTMYLRCFTRYKYVSTVSSKQIFIKKLFWVISFHF